MAKLSDELVMIRRYATLTCMYSSLEPGSDEEKAAELALNEYEAEILKRMGKVDVAGIAREILQNCAAKYSQPEMWNYNDPQSVIDKQIDNAADILLSHLEGKSE